MYNCPLFKLRFLLANLFYCQSITIFADVRLQMLKITVKILLVYLLFLAFEPCIDDCSTDFCHSEAVEHLEQKHTDDGHSDCSPLCNCVCCNITVTPCNYSTIEVYLNSLNAPHLLNLNLPFPSKSTFSPPPRS